MVLGAMKAGLEATLKPTLLDIAWAAAIIEGEGHMARVGGGPKCEIVTVTQKNQWVLERFRDFFGGRIYASPRLNGGRSVVPMWYATGARAHGIILTILTFLSPQKRQQAMRALGHMRGALASGRLALPEKVEV